MSRRARRSGTVRALGGMLFATIAVAALPVAAGASSDGAAVVAHIFDAADRDGDGVLSADEYAEAGLTRYGVGFEQCDADDDGRLTQAEYLEVYQRHHPPGDAIST